ncbi:MAG: LysR family transcriptional regulator [Pseudonocardia sp.]|nr:LysR family transcriptional regulator [Pseudonocardia sp.]
MDFTLEQLRGFVAVADELHFGRAAARLRMTQPPLSRQIQKLERNVGAQLLERDNRRVVLTAAGAVFLSEARRLLALAQAAPTLARRVSSGSTGLVRIAFTAVAAYGALGDVLAVLGRELPDVDVDLYEMVTRDQVQAVLDEEIDLGLARPPFDDETLDSRPLQREALVVALPTGHRLLAIGRALDGADLAGEPMIMYSATKARYFYDLVVGLIPVTHENVVHSVSQILTMVWLVAAGRGIGVVPASATRLGIAGVEYVPLHTPVRDPVELNALWLRGSRNPALGQAVRVLERSFPI